MPMMSQSHKKERVTSLQTQRGTHEYVIDTQSTPNKALLKIKPSEATSNNAMDITMQSSSSLDLHRKLLNEFILQQPSLSKYHLIFSNHRNLFITNSSHD